MKLAFHNTHYIVRGRLWMLMLLITPTLAAQQILSGELADRRPSFGVSLLPAIYQKTSIDPGGGMYNLNSTAQIGYEFLLLYSLYLDKDLRISYGLGANIGAYNFNYDIAKEMFDPPTTSNISSNKAASRTMDLFNIKFQAEVQYRIWENQGRRLLAGAGLSLLYAPPADESFNEFVFYASGGTRNFLYRSQNNDNRKKPWLNLHAIIGHDWVFAKRHALGVFIKINYSPVEFITGEYEVDPGSTPAVSGEYGVSGSYVGLGIRFTIPKR